ncbi:ketosteroid isomerase-like protein [Sphingobium sp. OAS761]|uniref:nuclear transport factor 2 family protein n=1 Tax=Sphingobium sp. OAS761 TaxID=2817901 RepID=UPI0020A0BF1F|nr:nuclear transport factor 2 family protein [Sphingobium sp. OAS761]MCP1471785.1 ketosteroid isomerase-like protein [Sphingobium sp. OAS761]
MESMLQNLADQAMIRRTAELYAQGADRRDKASWRAVMTEDYLLEGPGFTTRGRDANLKSIDLLERMFRSTQHRIHQVIATIDGDRASGETYCTADHLLRDSDAILIWAIRYQDEWRREADGQWRFAHRRLIVDWQETRPVLLEGSP